MAALPEEHTSTNPVNLTRFILHEQRGNTKAQGDFTMLLASVQLGIKAVESSIRRAGVHKLYGLAGDVNVQGEDVKKLDVLANEVFINALKFSEKICVMVSEENENAIIVKGVSDTKYVISFDPLDGSSNIDANVSVGTIFSIFRKTSGGEPSEKDALRPGREIVAAGYAMYGSATNLVLSTGKGVNGFTLDPTIGEFVLTHRNIRIPPRAKIYSCNEGNSANWDEPTKQWVNECKFPPEGKKAYSSRYIGSMVADVHRNLLYGGVFAYPADSKNKNGKLRLLYECAPMAYIVEQAGGLATTGRERILDVIPEKIHQRVPIFIGSAEDIKEIEALYAAYDAKQ